MVKRKIVVAGAVGVIGRTIVSHFEKLDDWQVVGLSRTKPDFPTKMQHIPVDLLDARRARHVHLGQVVANDVEANEVEPIALEARM